MCPKEYQPPSTTPSMNEETKSPSTFAEPKCKHCYSELSIKRTGCNRQTGGEILSK